MIRVAALLSVLLLAQSIDSGRSRVTEPGPSGAHVDRHIDAHVAPREGAPAASPTERPSRESPAPQPVIGTGAPAEPAPPAIPLYRDPFSRDRRH